MSTLGLNASPNHYSVTSIGDGRTQFIGCRLPAKSCVLFVHGFNGDALSTWKGFDSIALQQQAFKETDLVFFGYDGLRSNALASASFLYDLLDDLMSTRSLVPSVKRAAPAYDRCVIAAHSLGAVVTRWTLLRAFHQKSPWLDKVRYLLFAPAHCGGLVVDSVSELLGATAITKFLAGAAKAKLPLLNELAPNSTILKALEEQTRAAIEAGCDALRAKRVVIAEYEEVVSNIPFVGDPFPTAIRNARHTTVCKPDDFRDVIGLCCGVTGMSSGFTAEVRQGNLEVLIHNLEQTEAHLAIAAKFRGANEAVLGKLLRNHKDEPVSDPDEIEFRSRMDAWLGQVSLLYLAWLCGYVPDPGESERAKSISEILSNPALRPYYEQHYPTAIPWLFRLHLEGKVRLSSESSMDGAGAFERFSILYERFREDQDLNVFLNLLDGFWYGRTNIDSVVDSFQTPERVAEALARPADQITYFDRGISGMVRFLTFCHDLDQLLVLCSGMPLVRSAFWFFYAYWFHEYSVDVAQKSMEAIDKVMKAAESKGSDSTVDRFKWEHLLQRLTSGEFAKRLVAEMERAAAAGNADAAEWLDRFRAYTQPLKPDAFFFGASDENAPAPDAERIIQCGNAIRRMYKVQMFAEKLAPAIHQNWRDHLLPEQRGGVYDRPFHDMREDGKSANVAAAMRIPEILNLVGYELEFGESTPDQERAISARLEQNMEVLAAAEHDGWMEERRLSGWSYGAERDNIARKHPLLVPYDALPDSEKEKDRQTVRSYPSYARLAGLRIVPKRG